MPNYKIINCFIVWKQVSQTLLLLLYDNSWMNIVLDECLWQKTLPQFLQWCCLRKKLKGFAHFLQNKLWLLSHKGLCVFFMPFSIWLYSLIVFILRIYSFGPFEVNLSKIIDKSVWIALLILIFFSNFNVLKG